MNPRDIAEALLLFVRIVEHKGRYGICGSKAIRDEWKDDALDLIGVELGEDPIAGMQKAFRNTREDQISTALIEASGRLDRGASQTTLFTAVALFGMIKNQNNFIGDNKDKKIVRAAKAYDYIDRGFKFSMKEASGKGTTFEHSEEAAKWKDVTVRPKESVIGPRELQDGGRLSTRNSSYHESMGRKVRFNSDPKVQDLPMDKVSVWARKKYDPSQLSPPPPSPDPEPTEAGTTGTSKISKVSAI